MKRTKATAILLAACMAVPIATPVLAGTNNESVQDAKAVMGAAGKTPVNYAAPIVQTAAAEQYVTTSLYGHTFNHRLSDTKGTKITKVIDVSEHNGSIDFKKVKASGVEGVILRCGCQLYGSGKLKTDARFETNYTKAKAAGLKVGVYFYNEAISTSEAEKIATYTQKLLQGKDIDLWVAFDYENCGGRSNKVTKSKGASIAITFLNAMKKKGYRPMLYAGAAFTASHVDAAKVYAAGYPVWMARYNSYPYKRSVDVGRGYYSGKLAMWQSSAESGMRVKVSGVSGYVDFDWAYDPIHVSIQSMEKKLTVGGKQKLVAFSKTENFKTTYSESYTYKSSDASVLAVDANGALTPKKAGTAKIQATGKTSKDTAAVNFTVVQPVTTESVNPIKVTTVAKNKTAVLTWTAPTKSGSYNYRISGSGISTQNTTKCFASVKLGYGKTKALTVSAYTKDGKLLSKQTVTAKTPAAQVASLKVAKTTKSYVSLKWNKASGAAKYNLYRSTNGKTFTKYATTSALTYKNSKVKKGKTYWYKVSATAGNGKTGSYSKAVKAVVKK